MNRLPRPVRVVLPRVPRSTVNGYPTGKPKRDIVPTDGMKITVGDRTVTIYLTPGHTPGTISSIFQVHDHGNPLTVVYSGGTEFNFPNDVPHFDQYLASERRLASLAAAAGATIVLNNQSQFNGAATKLRMLKDIAIPARRIPWTSGPARWRNISRLKTNARRQCV